MYLALLRIWLLVGASAAQDATFEAQKPVCSARTLGRMWPDAANDDPRLVVQLSRSGRLEICERNVWRYRWQSPTVSLDRLRQQASRKP